MYNIYKASFRPGSVQQIMPNLLVCPWRYRCPSLMLCQLAGRSPMLRAAWLDGKLPTSPPRGDCCLGVEACGEADVATGACSLGTWKRAVWPVVL
jgi:hypothetical protein